MSNNQKPWWIVDGVWDGIEGLSQALRDSGGISLHFAACEPALSDPALTYSASTASESDSSIVLLTASSTDQTTLNSAPVLTDASVGTDPSVEAAGGLRVLIQFVADAPPSIQRETVASAGGRIAGRVHAADHAAGDLIVVEFPTTKTLQFVQGALSNNRYVRFVEMDSAVSVNLVSNDPSYTDGTLWNMQGDQTAPFANAFGCQAGEAWNMGHTGAPSVVAGVIDTGIDYTHPDLYLNIWINQGELPAGLADVDGDQLITFRDLNDVANAASVTDINGNGYIDGGDLLADARWEDGRDQDGNGFVDDLIGWDFANSDNDPIDDHNHGTHVSGTIGALGGNGTGVAGVNWAVEMMPLKFLAANGAGYTSNAIKALDYYTAMAAKGGTAHYIGTNNSWSGGSYSQSLQDGITRTASQQQLFIAAAGNNASNNDVLANYPTNYSTLGTAGWDAVVSVAALDRTGMLASYSNYGLTSVDLAAPGSAIWSTLTGGRYGNFSGTSMAAPHVTGSLALLAAANSGLDGASLRTLLLGSTIATSSLDGKVVSGGRLDAASLLTIGISADLFAPTAKLTLLESAADGSLTFRLVFSESVIGLAADDISVSAGSLTGLVSTGVNSFALTVTPSIGVEDNLIVRLRDQAVTDPFGNSNAAVSSAPIYIDTKTPTLLSLSTVNGIDGAFLNSPIELHFSERLVPGSGSITLVGPAGVVASYLVSDVQHVVLDGNRIVLYNDALMAAATNYSVLVDPGAVVDAGGNAIAATQAIFQTGSQTYSQALSGTSGADSLIGNWGNDILNGKAGIDMLDGGQGSDIYIITQPTEHVAAEVSDTGKSGEDELRFAASSSATLTLFAGDTGLERVVIGTGTAAVADLNGNKQIGVDASQVLNGLLIVGNAGANTLVGTAYGDIFYGNGGNDIIVANAGDDVLHAGAGTDTMTGGAGADSFVFDTPAVKNSPNFVTDFETGVDRIVLSNGVFPQLQAGSLSPDNFWAGSAAADYDDYVLYNPITGALSYDPDGNGRNAAVIIATFGTTTHPQILPSDIVTVL